MATTFNQSGCPEPSDLLSFAKDVAKRIKKDYQGRRVPVTFTGHGLGGSLAALAAIECGEQAAGTGLAFSCSAVTFSAPGALGVAVTDALGPVTVHSYVMKGDLVPLSGWHLGTVCVLPGSHECLGASGVHANCMGAEDAHKLETIVEAVKENLYNSACTTAPGRAFSLFDYLLNGLVRGSSQEQYTTQLSKASYLASISSTTAMSDSAIKIMAGLSEHGPQAMSEMLQDSAWPEQLGAFELPGLVSVLSEVGEDLYEQTGAAELMESASNVALDFLETMVSLTGTLPDELQALETAFEYVKTPVTFLAQFLPQVPDVPQVILDATDEVTLVLDFVIDATERLVYYVDQGKRVLDRTVNTIGLSIGGKPRPSEDKSCGAEVCLGIHERSLGSYREWIFPMQYTRFWDIASPPIVNVFNRKHRFTLPGLYSTYAVRSATFLVKAFYDNTVHHEKFLVAMCAEGSGVERGLPSLFVVLNKDGSIMSVIELEHNPDKKPPEEESEGEGEGEDEDEGEERRAASSGEEEGEGEGEGEVDLTFTGSVRGMTITGDTDDQMKIFVSNDDKTIAQFSRVELMQLLQPGKLKMYGNKLVVEDYVYVEVSPYSLFYDKTHRLLWVGEMKEQSKEDDGKDAKAVAYEVSARGTVVLPSSFVPKEEPDKPEVRATVVYGPDVKGFFTFRQLGLWYVGLTRCSLNSNPCKIEYHNYTYACKDKAKADVDCTQLDPSTWTLINDKPKGSVSTTPKEKTLVTALSVPFGAEGIASDYVDNGYYLIPFSSGTEEGSKLAVTFVKDMEDSMFLFGTPVMRTQRPAVTRNVMYCTILGIDVVPPRCFVKYKNGNCGSNKGQEPSKDVKRPKARHSGRGGGYKHIRSKSLVHATGLALYDDTQPSTRAERLVVSGDDDICLENTYPLYPAKEQVFGWAKFIFPVYIAQVTITIELSGSLGVDLEGIVCFLAKAAGIALVPKVQAKVMLEGAIEVVLVRAGIEVRAVILDVDIPAEAAITFKDGGSPPVLHFRLSISLSPLQIKLSLFGEYYFCIGTCYKEVWGVNVGYPCTKWCKRAYFTLWEYKMERWNVILWEFKTKSIDSTPPDTGLVKITQEDVKSLQISWTGFDVSLDTYITRD
jgi:hypothetical protein